VCNNKGNISTTPDLRAQHDSIPQYILVSR